MTTLKEQLSQDRTQAMRDRDKLRTETLRMALAAVKTEEVAGDEARELSDDEVLKVITREVKKRREAADAYETGGRADAAERERAESEVLAGYLPKQLTDGELTDVVREAIQESGAEGPRGMGAVMKIVNPKVGDRAEGRRVADEVKRQLAG